MLLRERTSESIPVYERQRNVALFLGGVLLIAGLKLSDKHYSQGVAIASLGATTAFLGGVYNQSQIELINNPEKFLVNSRLAVVQVEEEVSLALAA